VTGVLPTTLVLYGDMLPSAIPPPATVIQLHLLNLDCDETHSAAAYTGSVCRASGFVLTGEPEIIRTRSSASPKIAQQVERLPPSHELLGKVKVTLNSMKQQGKKLARIPGTAPLVRVLLASGLSA